MKHFILLLYLISYTSGIGAITLFTFYYIKYRHQLIRYMIYTDLFFTLTLIFDTLNYYGQIISPNFSKWFSIFSIYGLLVGCVGVSYFLALLVFQSTGLVWNKQRRIIFSSTSIIALITINLFLFLQRLKIIPSHIGFHTGFSIPNLFVVTWFFYLASVVIRRLDFLDANVQSMNKMILIISSILLPLSVLANLVQYKCILPYPIAFSPLEYFILNIVFIGSALKYFLGENHSATVSSFLDPESSLMENPKNIFQENNITEREFGIIGLIIDGYNNSEIGKKLFISPNTVRNHIYNIYRKLGVKSRYELINLIINENSRIDTDNLRMKDKKREI